MLKRFFLALVTFAVAGAAITGCKYTPPEQSSGSSDSAPAPAAVSHA